MKLSDIIIRGTLAARPAATTLPNGSLYATTDTNEVYEVVEAAWVTFVDGNGGAGAPGGADKNAQYNNAGVLGGVTNNATATKKYLQQVSSGTPSMEQVAAADVSGLAASATTDTTVATNISSGTLPIDRIADAEITKAKIENVAASKLLGRGSAGGAGAPEEITLGTNLTMAAGVLNASSGVNNPGGSDKNVQYNDAGAFGGVANNATATKKYLQQVSSGTPSIEQVADADLAVTDVTTNNVSTSAHGFAPKAPNDATKFLDGTGAYSVPAGGGGGTTQSYPVADVQVARGVVLNTGGDYTLGVIWACIAAATLNGFKFGYNGFASKTVKWTLYDNGYDGTGSTVIETSTIAVSAAQVYAVTLSTPKVLDPGKVYTIGIYINDGSNLIYYTSLLPPWGNQIVGGGSQIQFKHPNGPTLWLDIAAYVAGDGKPVTGNGSNCCPIQLTYA